MEFVTNRQTFRSTGNIELDNSHTSQLTQDTNGIHKVLITGNFVEIYSQESLIGKRFEYPDKNKRNRILEYQNTSRNQSYKRLRTLCYGNFKKYDKFVTLTFDPKRDKNNSYVDLTKCNWRKEAYLKKLRKLYPDIKYIIIPEYQRSGRIHYHMVCDLPYVDLELMTKTWSYGIVKTEAIREFDRTFQYLAKYISKNFGSKDRFKGKKRFYCSSNLTRPIEYRGHTANQVVFDIQVQKLQPIMEYSYYTPFGGKIYYEAYLVASVTPYG